MERTQQQSDAIELRADRICVDAGAGSGKTRILVERVAAILENKEAKLEEIAAITFTEKAAAEMKERLRRAFREKASAPRITPDEMSRWRNLERSVEMARISTIHSFCASLLRENALLLGLDPDFAVLAEAETALLMEETITETLHVLFEQRDESATRLATEMRVSELKGISATLLQRRNLLERIANRYPLDDPTQLRQRWEQVTTEEHKRRLAALGHSRTLRHYLKALRRFEGKCINDSDSREAWRRTMLDALSRIGQNSDPETAEKELARLAEKPDGKARKNNWSPPEAFAKLSRLQDSIRDFASDVLESLSDPETEKRAAQITADLFKTAQHVIRALAEAKTRLNAFDFDDLIAGALRMLRDDETLRLRTARGIKFLLIDEFQDTDGMQLEIARLLTDYPGGPSLFIVGDAKQSVYRFRGAEVEVFEQERERAKRVLPLDCNFRSLPDVLGFVNHFLGASGLLGAVEDYKPMAVHRAALGEPQVEFLVTGPSDGAKWLAEDYRRAEARLIAGRIQALCEGDTPASVYDERTASWRSADYGDVAILFRAMSNVYLYEEELRKARVPYTVIAGAGFYTRQEVLDVLNVLKVVLDPWDEAALLGFLRGPIAGLSDESILRLARAGGLAVAFGSDQAPDRFPQRENFSRARELIAGLRARTDLALPAFLRHVLNVTGYEAIALTQFPGLQRASNVRKLIDLAQDFAHQRPPSLRAFVQYLTEVGSQNIREGEASLQPTGAGAVTLMSVHKSKGLEFPVVVIPDMSQGHYGSRTDALFLHRELGMAVKVADATGDPVTPAMGEAINDRIADEEEAENARLLYVAMTRARDYLVMSGTDKPGAGSWFEALDDEYAIASRDHGALISGEGWRAVVLRQAGDVVKKVDATAETVIPSREALLRRIEPVPAIAPHRLTFSISSILDHMAGGFDEHEERGGADAERGGGAARALVRGALVHRMFEVWDFTADVLPPVEALTAEARVGLGERDGFAEELRAIAERFRKIGDLRTSRGGEEAAA